MTAREDNFLWLGILISFLSSTFLFLVFPSGKIDRYDKAIEQCEATLPRDVKCVITAVPEGKK